MKPPPGMIVHMQKVMPTFSSVFVLIVFSWPYVWGSTSGAPLGACSTLGMPPRLIPPNSVGKPDTNSPPSSIVTIPFNWCWEWLSEQKFVKASDVASRLWLRSRKCWWLSGSWMWSTTVPTTFPVYILAKSTALKREQYLIKLKSWEICSQLTKSPGSKSTQSLQVDLLIHPGLISASRLNACETLKTA